MIEERIWYDEEAGPLVRPYAVTSGRTRTAQLDLHLITLVVALREVNPELAQILGPEHLQILSMSQTPLTVAEISAGTALPLSVVKILLGDLIDRRLLISRSDETPDATVIQAVIDGIRRL
ncbi:MAG TPA: DUF742 domain-containing protein [Kineosporiaceae bacterium]|jgi:hypothetical protein|nr:DUF742 domain-containing protein [Kineosporiaceae bacterium]